MLIVRARGHLSAANEPGCLRLTSLDGVSGSGLLTEHC